MTHLCLNIMLCRNLDRRQWRNLSPCALFHTALSLLYKWHIISPLSESNYFETSLSLDLSSVAAYFFHTDCEKQNRTSTAGYKMLGYVVIPQEPFLERTVSNQQGESQLPATNVIPNSRVIFLVVVFQTFCCMAITQTTALKDHDVFRAALGLFPTELLTNPYFGSWKVIRVVHSKVQVMVPSTWCHPWCPWVCARMGLVLNTEEERKAIFLTACSVLKQEHKRTPVKAPSRPVSSLQLKQWWKASFSSNAGKHVEEVCVIVKCLIKRFRRTLLQTDKLRIP